MNLLCTLKALVVATGLLLSASSFAADLKSLTDKLDRLDQMDRQDMQVHIDAATACTRARNYPCSEQRLKQAEQVAVDGKDREAISRARKALAAEKELAAKEEEVKLAAASKLRIAETCAGSCPIAREYDQCVRGSIEHFECGYEETQQTSQSPGPRPNVAADIQAALAANRAAAGRISDIHNNMVGSINAQARQRAELQEQRLPAQRRQADETAARNAQATREREQRAAQQEQAAEQARAQVETRIQLAQASGSGRPDGAAGSGRVVAGGGAAAAKPSDPGEPDNDGCIEAIGWCSTAHSVETKGRNQILRFKNTCPFRVYGSFHNGRAGGKADSGADAVRAGGTHSWSTVDGDGRSFIRIVGSAKASADWTCAGKLKNGGFTAGDSTLERR